VNRVLLQAFTWADRGWPVFPCLSNMKVPLTRHGYRDASTDPDQISEWFARHPHRNLAVATGAPGPDVLNIDYRGPAASGFPALARLREAGLLDEAAASVRTPSGGLHLYFAGTGQRTSHLPATHINFLAAGGYVLSPPSNVGGKPYQHTGLLAGRGALDWETAARLLEPIRGHQPPAPRPAPGQQISVLANWVAAQQAGNRNAGVFWAANRVLETDRAADLSILAAAARQAGLGDQEIARTLGSARTPEPADPEAAG
jgi:hypothetical protein